jgi:hypothetical protein
VFADFPHAYLNAEAESKPQPYGVATCEFRLAYAMPSWACLASTAASCRVRMMTRMMPAAANLRRSGRAGSQVRPPGCLAMP